MDTKLNAHKQGFNTSRHLTQHITQTLVECAPACGHGGLLAQYKSAQLQCRNVQCPQAYSRHQAVHYHIC